ASVQCSFCNSTIIVPSDWRANRSRTTKLLHNNRLAGYYFLFITVTFLFGIGIFIALKPSKQPTIPQKRASKPQFTPISPLPKPPQDWGFAHLVLTFGGEGTGPGLFNDARNIALDASGNIYVSDYIGGRIQVFDETGKFITQWMGDTKM